MVGIVALAYAPPAETAGADTSAADPASGVFYDGFESRNDGWKCDLDAHRTGSFEACDSAEEANRLRRATPSNPRDGSAMRFRIPPNGEPVGDASHPHRSELTHREGTAADAPAALAPLGEDSWYGFSNSINSNVANVEAGSIVAQWHKMPGNGEGGAPPVALWVFKPDDHPPQWRLRLNPADGSTRTWIGPPVEIGGWNDWVFHINWSCDSPEGLIEAWLNGEKVFDTRIDSPGPVCSGLSEGPYFKTGLYHPAWSEVPTGETIDYDDLVLYVDEVRIHRGGGNYDEVAPPGSQDDGDDTPPTSGDGDNPPPVGDEPPDSEPPPDDGITTTTTTAEETTTTVQHASTTATSGPSTSQVSDDELPNTGSNSTVMLVGLGAALLAVGGALVFGARRAWRRFV